MRIATNTNPRNITGCTTHERTRMKRTKVQNVFTGGFTDVFQLTATNSYLQLVTTISQLKQIQQLITTKMQKLPDATGKPGFPQQACKD